MGHKTWDPIVVAPLKQSQFLKLGLSSPKRTFNTSAPSFTADERADFVQKINIYKQPTGYMRQYIKMMSSKGITDMVSPKIPPTSVHEGDNKTKNSGDEYSLELWGLQLLPQMKWMQFNAKCEC